MFGYNKWYEHTRVRSRKDLLFLPFWYGSRPKDSGFHTRVADGPKGEWSIPNLDSSMSLKKTEHMAAQNLMSPHFCRSSWITIPKRPTMEGPSPHIWNPNLQLDWCWIDGLTEGRPQLGLGKLLTEFLHFFLWSGCSHHQPWTSVFFDWFMMRKTYVLGNEIGDKQLIWNGSNYFSPYLEA